MSIVRDKASRLAAKRETAAKVEQGEALDPDFPFVAEPFPIALLLSQPIDSPTTDAP